jgi:hypothetical protein
VTTTMQGEPATKRDFEVLRGEFRGELAAVEARLSADLASKADLAALESRLTSQLTHELAQHTKAILEQGRIWFGALDDKISANTQRAAHDALRADFEAHRGDEAVHRPGRRRRTR